MKKTTIAKLFAIFFTLPVLLFSCVETQPEQKPDNGNENVTPGDSTSNTPNTKPSVEIAAEEAASSTLTFTINVANVDKCSWMCIPSNEDIPDDIYVIQKGTEIDVAASPVTCIADNLKPETEYAVVAAIMSKKGYATEVIYMTTTAAELPSATIDAKTVSSNFITFEITTANATKCAWVCIKSDETRPSDQEILASGTHIAISAEPVTCTATVEPDTEYTIIVTVEGNGGVTSHDLTVRSAEASSGNENATVELASGEIKAHEASFDITATKALSAIWYVYPTKAEAPTLDYILSQGTPVDISSGSATVEVTGLHSSYDYTILVAVLGEGAPVLSDPLEISTPDDVDAFEFDIVSANWLSYVTGGGAGETYITFTGDEPQRTEMAVDFYCIDNTNGLTAGTYIMNGTKQYGTIYDADTYLEIYKDGGLERTVSIVSGSAHVTVSDKKHTIDIDFVDTDGRHYISSFNGTIKIKK